MSLRGVVFVRTLCNCALFVSPILQIHSCDG